MRMAVAYDYLNQYGGGERVLQEILRLYPDAEVYTLFYEPSKLGGLIPSERIKGTSWLDYGPVRQHHWPFIPLMPRAAKGIDLGDQYEVILSVGASYAKGISYSGGRHASYCFTPLRYAWEAEEYLPRRLGWIYSIIRPLVKVAAERLRRWDERMGRRADKIATLSSFMAERIRECYGREATVIYPPVNREIFYNTLPYPPRNYYLAVGRLMHYKRFDLVIEAFNRWPRLLKILGRGPELERLRKINKSATTEFITELVSDSELREIYNGARAVIFPQREDFGLVAAEAVACGTPVIAYRAGGALDIVSEGVNGLFIKEQTPEAIGAALKRLESRDWEAKKIEATAVKFSKEQFAAGIKRLVEED